MQIRDFSFIFLLIY